MTGGIMKHESIRSGILPTYITVWYRYYIRMYKENVTAGKWARCCGGSPGRQRSPKTNVSARKIVPSIIYRRINLDGDITSLRSADVVPNTGGVVHSFLVEEGPVCPQGTSHCPG